MPRGLAISNAHRILVAVLFCLAFPGCGGGGGQPGLPPAAPLPVSIPPPAAPVSEQPTFSEDYLELFSLEKMHTITISISEAEWNSLLNDFDANPRNEIFRRADFTYGEGNQAEAVNNVGFRLRGNVFSRARPEAGNGLHDPSNRLQRVHFRIRFNEQFKDAENVYGWPSQEIVTLTANKDRDFRSVRSLNLKYNKNDPTYIREVFSYDLFQRFGVETVRQAYTRLFIRIGDEPARYMGVYLMGEHVDKTWAQRRFGKNAIVFKSLYQGHGPADLAHPDLDHNIDTGRIGSELTDPVAPGYGFSPYRPAYDLKTKRRNFAEAEAELNQLIQLLTGNPTPQMLTDAIDVETLLRAQAVNVFLGNWDDYWRNGNNYYLALHPVNNRWVFIPYDYDIALFDQIWMFGDIAGASFLHWGDDRLSGSPVLMDKILGFAEFRDQYTGYIAELLNDDSPYASATAIRNRLIDLQEIVLPYSSGYDAEDSIPFSADLSAIEAYVQQRIATARAEIGF